MGSYEFLAGCYDELTYDVGYSAWADYIEAHFRKRGLPGKTVLDLACGTGSLTRELAQRGYEMIGVDRSPEMLSEAAEKNRDVGEVPPIFLCQSMDKLDLYGTIDACVCCLDSVNYVTDPRQLRKAFQRVYLFLMPGGLCLFDINTPSKLQGLDGQIFLDENDESYCVWRAEFDESERICYYGMDLFQREGKLWRRSFEEHREYAYTVSQLTAFLQAAGFSQIECYGDRQFTPPKAGEQRIYFYAAK